MNKNLKIAIFAGIVVVAAAAAGSIYFVSKSSTKAEMVVSNYFELLNNKEYSEMYKLLSEESKSKISEDDFVKRNKNIYEGIDAENIKVTIGDNKKDKGNVTINYDTEMNTAAGELSFSNSVEVVKGDNKEYNVNWSSNVIFPDLDDDNKVRINTSKAKRGSILDRNGNIIASDGITANVGIVPGKLENKDAAISSLSSILGISVEDINSKLNASYVTDTTFVPLKTISDNDAETKSKLLQIKGVQINDKSARVYPLGQTTAHLTGYVQAVTAEDLENLKGQGYNSNSVIGKSGLEKLYEEKLKAVDGAEIYITEANGKKKSILVSKELQNGQDVKLTIDTNLQNSLYTQLSNDKGAAVAMNPNTGEVLALVSTPSYDPNDFILGMSNEKWDSLNNDANKPLYNRFKASFAPGSTFKPITAVIGLETKTLDKDADKNISGLSWQKDSSWGSYNVTRVHEYANANLDNALIYSDNIYFAMAALDIGKDNFTSKLNSFGFNEELPFSFGLTPSSYGKMDSDVKLADSGYGQAEVLVNPVHLATMYTMFNNNGTMIKPTLEYKANAKGEAFKENVASKDTINSVVNGMVQVVENPNGTAHNAGIPGLTIAAKTGTAEIKASQDDATGTETGWFVATTTNQNDNNLLIVSMAEDVKDKGGSHYLVPMVRQSMASYYGK
ncbi:penicillin-binding protein [Clostridium sp. DSM 8431]|uniref:penicillin-binding transpeptidase domain-containing protein n=1 Tax=Clostridium sp. DSM 8431 TaxID=1761781 RepID=UPI0008E0260B|nr:penicillin-binding transpeptidase domain-containing protein [Clostridium sp. DSM 8431]SFU35414.1 penicillin-binding protein [Clostridium sp. DSM 8431]